MTSVPMPTKEKIQSLEVPFLTHERLEMITEDQTDGEERPTTPKQIKEKICVAKLEDSPSLSMGDEIAEEMSYASDTTEETIVPGDEELNMDYKCVQDSDQHVIAHIGGRQFQCSKCEMNFLVMENLSVSDIHCRRTDHKKKKKSYSCAQCGKSCCSHHSLKSHKQMHLSNNESLHNQKCFVSKGISKKTRSISEPTSKQTQTVKKINIVQKKSLNCEECNKIFPTVLRLRTHMRKMHSEVKLDTCENSTNTSSELTQYTCTQKDENKECAIENVAQKHEEFPIKVKPFECETCKKCFLTKAALKEHENIHTGNKPFQCSFCSKCFPHSGSLYRHKKLHIGVKSFKCHFCEKAFYRASHLSRHILRIHSGEKAFKCNKCEKVFWESSELKAHKQSHPKGKPFVCPTCGKCFAFEGLLVIHVRTHTGEKPYACSKCEKTFPSTSTLNSHMSVHDPFAKKPHLCSECGKCFKTKSRLKIHTDRHIGKKAHECNICGKSYFTITDLRYHMRIHTGERPYKCTQCDKCFRVLQCLYKHSETHLSEKSHVCNQCPKAFTTAQKLTRHLLTHTGEKPFPCYQCGKRFPSQTNLKRHMRNIHKILV